MGKLEKDERNSFKVNKDVTSKGESERMQEKAREREQPKMNVLSHCIYY